MPGKAVDEVEPRDVGCVVVRFDADPFRRVETGAIRYIALAAAAGGACPSNANLLKSGMCDMRSPARCGTFTSVYAGSQRTDPAPHWDYGGTTCVCSGSAASPHRNDDPGNGRALTATSPEPSACYVCKVRHREPAGRGDRSTDCHVIRHSTDATGGQRSQSTTRTRCIRRVATCEIGG